VTGFQSLRLRYRVIALAVVCVLSFLPAGTGRCDSVVAGGLDAVEPGYTLGPNLLVNADFRSGLKDWTFDPSCFSLDGTADASLRLQEPCAQQSPFAENAFKCPPGLYTISAEVKTQSSITVPKRLGGARVRLLDAPSDKWAMTQAVVGTTDWTSTAKAHAAIADGSVGSFRAETVGPVAGTSWFRKLFLSRELPAALQTFLLYPNYRGMMFSDQSYMAQISIEVNPPAGMTMSQLRVVLEVSDPAGKVLLTNRVSPPANGSAIATLDMHDLPLGRYRLQGYLVGPDDKRVFAPSSYTIVKVSSSEQTSMKTWIDSDNVIHMGGRPRFVIGLYDTTGSSQQPDYYTARLHDIAKAPINLMINYFLSTGDTDVIDAYTEAMAPFGIYYLDTVSAFFPEMHAYPLSARTRHLDADELITRHTKALERNSRVVGYYVCDECASEVQPRTFHQYALVKQNDPASVTYAVNNYPNEFQFWRDTVDVLGVDPYVLGSRQTESYVGDMTRSVVAAVHNARPVWTVIQFFRLTALSHFPTESELHDMSWMAITEGARGVFYWSYGLRGLDWGKRDPVLRQKRYDELVNVTKGISALEPVLLAPDSPVLSANSAAGTVITKEKDMRGGSRYLISYNHSGSSIDASFTLNRPAHEVSVDGENRSITLDPGGSKFKDAYAPYQAHVYKID
jgi:hypothetical protein